jgi:hypothetical protein
VNHDEDPTTGTCDDCAKEYILGDEEDHCGECGQCNDHCDCEPVTCYNTGGRCHAGCGCDKALAESQARHDRKNR